MGVIILADGKSKTTHLDNHRLLTPINGEPLLHRTIRQFGWTNPVVISSDPTIVESVTPLARVHPGSDHSHIYHGADMIRKALHLCRDYRNVVLFGDVVFTDYACQVIKEYRTPPWGVYGRSVGSPLTAPWAEFFAIDIASSEVGRAFQALETVAEHYNSQEWWRCSPWEWYFEMERMPYHIPDPQAVTVGSHWTEIKDETDDIDFLEDAERIQKIYE